MVVLLVLRGLASRLFSIHAYLTAGPGLLLHISTKSECQSVKRGDT